MRKSYGQCKSVADLRAIKGSGPKRMEKMREYVTVGKSVAPKKAANAGATSSGSPSTAKSPPHAPAKSWHQNPSDVATRTPSRKRTALQVGRYKVKTRLRDILHRRELRRFI